MDRSDEDPAKQPRGVFRVRESEEMLETTGVNPEDILDRVEGIEIHEWTYSPESGIEIKHLGPVAEDFHELFELGEGVENIATNDVDGVVLTTVKKLASRLDDRNEVADRHERCIERQQTIIADQRDDIETLRKNLESLQATVFQLGRQLDERG